jgi:hypothetical protein
MPAFYFIQDRIRDHANEKPELKDIKAVGTIKIAAAPENYEEEKAKLSGHKNQIQKGKEQRHADLDPGYQKSQLQTGLSSVWRRGIFEEQL